MLSILISVECQDCDFISVLWMTGFEGTLRDR
jgi:hypothetical protein